MSQDQQLQETVSAGLAPISEAEDEEAEASSSTIISVQDFIGNVANSTRAESRLREIAAGEFVLGESFSLKHFDETKQQSASVRPLSRTGVTPPSGMGLLSADRPPSRILKPALASAFVVVCINN